MNIAIEDIKYLERKYKEYPAKGKVCELANCGYTFVEIMEIMDDSLFLNPGEIEYNTDVKTYQAGTDLLVIKSGTVTNPPEVVYAEAGEQHIAIRSTYNLRNFGNNKMEKNKINIRHFGKIYQVELEAPKTYWTLHEDDKARICNGCGPACATFDFIPDSIFFLKIGEACNIHDYCYHIGECEEDRKKADNLFLQNISRIVRQITKYRWLKLLRLRRAHTYYLAVQIYGEEAFMAGKI